MNAYACTHSTHVLTVLTLYLKVGGGGDGGGKKPYCLCFSRVRLQQFLFLNWKRCYTELKAWLSWGGPIYHNGAYDVGLWIEYIAHNSPMFAWLWEKRARIITYCVCKCVRVWRVQNITIDKFPSKCQEEEKRPQRLVCTHAGRFLCLLRARRWTFEVAHE